MTKGIYAYTDKKNDEIVYVGRDSHIHEDRRHKNHFQPSKYNQQVINRILQKNPDRYTYQRLWEINDCTDNHLNEMEKYYTKIYDPKFSFTEGGDGVSGYKWTDEQKRKKSESMKGENHPMYGRTGEKSPVYGRKHTEEELKKMSEKRKEYWKNEENRKKMSGENNPNWNKPLSEEHKRKISKTESKQCNTTGFYRVSRQNNSSYKKGFCWRYRYHLNSKRKCISSVDLNKLKEKVLDQGLEWEILDEEKAKQSLKKNNEDAIK